MAEILITKAMNIQTLHAHCQSATGQTLADKRGLMLTACRSLMYSSAVDVAKTDNTGILKTELQTLLRVKLDRMYYEDMEGWAGKPISGEERAMNQLENWKPCPKADTKPE
ncbi:MAG TPA: hypothetical protein VGE35_04345 [Candidatus Paceibacterota bacterium]